MKYYVIVCGWNVEFVSSKSLDWTEFKLNELRDKHFKDLQDNNYREDYSFDIYNKEYQWTIELVEGE